MAELVDLLRTQKELIATLKATARHLKHSMRDTALEKTPPLQRLLLLRMTESLIAAHKTAKIDNDGYTLDLIEDALRHVGGRLAKETGDARQFTRKRLEPF